MVTGERKCEESNRCEQDSDEMLPAGGTTYSTLTFHFDELPLREAGDVPAEPKAPRVGESLVEGLCR